jgi:hypothetical protein
MPVAGEDGVSLHRFDAAYQLVDSKLVVPSGPVRAMTAAQLGVAMFGVWTTDNACHMMQTSTFSAGLHTQLAVACPDPRVAVDQKTGTAVIVFGSDDGVRLTTNFEAQTGGAGHVLRSETSAPRTVFDGTSFWVSYLDSRGDVVVGILDANRNIVSMSLAGPKPERGAYELVLVDGHPWVFALGSEGYAAYRLCVDAQW